MGPSPEVVEAVVRRIEADEIVAFLAQGKSCGWCRHPVRLKGARVAVDHDTEERIPVFDSADCPDGVVLKACGNRRETRCPSCAAVYREDARHLVKSGLEGGKGVPATLQEHPAVLLTLTAPSFGAVHVARGAATPCRPDNPRRRCAHGRPMACFSRHDHSEGEPGTPICPACYRYDEAVLHNAAVPELWRRTSIYIPRRLAAILGVTQAECRRRLRVSYLRVAEFQRRGAVHLHVIVRLDATDGSVPVEGAEALAQACMAAARSAAVPIGARMLRWGEQVDVSILDRGDARAGRLAAYVSKYAVKSADASGALDYRIRSEEDLAARRLQPHERRLVARAWVLGADPSFEALHLRRHAHVLGYGGHFLGKSRSYSTTFTALRRAREAWREANRPRLEGEPAGATYEGTWRAVGIGWATRGEAALAEQSRQSVAHARRMAAFDRYDRERDG